MKTKRNVITKSNNIVDYTFIKALIDTYVISELAAESNGGTNYYEKKITTSVVINSLCAALEGIDCEYTSYLDLTINYGGGDRRNLDDDDANIDDLTLPLCIIEHTETNIILSVSCPRNLENNLKQIIIDAFESMKPKTIKGPEEDKSLADTIIEERDNKIYINSFYKICKDDEMDKICDNDLDLITDKDGNLISCNRLLKTETESMSDEYEIEVVTENGGSLDPNVYRTNLENILDFIGTNMEKETYIHANTIEDIINEENNELRNLIEDTSMDPGKQEKNVFCTEYSANKVCLSLLDNMLKGDGDESETSSEIIYNNDRNELSNNKVNSNLTTTINDFKAVSNAANSVATELFNKIINLLTGLADTINSEFTEIDNNLPFKDLSSIYDSTFAIGGMNEFPYTIVSAAKNVFSNIKNLNDDLLYTIDDYKKMLKNSVSSFLANSHNLMNTIFNKLKELTNALSSTKSKIANIASFYGLNTTNVSFVAVIEKANNILENYYIEEKKLIEPLLNNRLDLFLNNSNEKINNGHYIFDNITNRLEDQSVVINRGDENDIRVVIDNLYNTKILEKQIPESIVEYMKKNIIQSNGYFVTQKFIEDNNRSFVPIRENAINIAKTMDNCEYVDQTFDEIMKYFREQLIVILKNMEKSKIEKFPINANVPDDSNIKTSLTELDEFFKNEKVNINNLVKNENKNIMDSIQQKINSFIETYKIQLDNTVKNIDNSLSKLYLNNIDVRYNEMLSYTMNNITYVIDYNNDLLLQYMNDIAGTTHLTNTIINKLNVFIQRINEINSYLSNSLKNDLVIKYKNVINQIRSNLQTIKSNSFINQYNVQKDLSFLKTHLNTFIDPLFLQLDDCISDKNFNTKYLSIINNFINNCKTKINNQINKFNELYNPIKGRTRSSDTNNDIYVITCSNCCVKRTWYRKCKRRENKYEGRTVGSSLNYNKIKSISFSDYSKDFDKYYNQIYSIFSNNVVSYNNIISVIDNQLKTIINNYSNKNIDYLTSISERAKSFINEKLGTNILQSSYNYYKNDLTEKLPTELNSILEQWKTVYNKVYQDIDTNINKFKYPIGVFGNLATLYYYFYYLNISYFYSDSVIEQRKNDFNYTIKNYYNLFLSKVTKTYSYILNNMPKNEKPFDTLLNNQINKIKNSKSEILNLITLSRNDILNIKKQLNTLKVSETNFFGVNSFAVDIQDVIEEQLSQLSSDIDTISYRANNRFDSEESVSIWFYLENLINGKQINDLYDIINKGTFIEFQNDAYQTLFEDTLEIDEIDLKNRILNFFTQSNEELTKSFESKKEKYKNMLQNKMFENLYQGKNGLEQKINSLYSEGLNDLDVDSKNKILKYIDDIIETVKNHMTNEKSRLENELTSYTNNYEVFKQRLNNLGNEIYDKFSTVIFSVTNDFYTNIKKIFYTDFIEENLDEYYNQTIKEKFSEHTFLNISLNLKEIMDSTIETLTSEYKNWTLNQLNFLNDKKIQHLNELLSMTTLKNEINNRLINLYNTLLLNVLKEKAIYTQGNEGYSDYDFSEAIMTNINSVINTKISETQKIIQKMEGNITKDWGKPDFSQVKRYLFEDIKSDFKNFTDRFDLKENQDFQKEISTSINNNFQQIIDDFVPSFGKDFFERILKFNEIQKIQSLYQNLKYSIGITLSYYILLTEYNSIDSMPEDLEIKILSLNNINSVITSKNNQVLSILNSKFDEFLELTKNKLVEKYINYMENDYTLKTSFNDNILDLIKALLEKDRYLYGDKYINTMNSIIKNPFIEQYTNTIEKASKDMIDYVEENKELLRIELKDLLVMNKDETLNNIETKLNDTLKAIENYNSHFASFAIPQDFKNYLDNFVDNNILSHHQEIKDILDDKTKNIILDYLNITSGNFRQAYIFKNMESQLNDTNDLFKNQYFDKMIQYLKEYGTIDEIYIKKLEKALTNEANSSMRILEENDGNLADLKLEKTFKQLRESSLSNKQYVETVDIFSQFNDKIDKYINNIKEQYEVSKNNILSRKYTEEVNEQLYQSLEELKELSLSYYNKVKLQYNKIKEYVEKSISKVDTLIEESNDITNKTIKNKYQEIINNYNSINKIVNETGKIEEKRFQNGNTQVEIKINDFLFNNKFFFDFEDQKLRGRSINENRPRSFVVDFSIKIGKCVLKGKEMTISLNDISSIIALDYDVSSTEAKINKIFNLDEYNIDNKFYNETKTIIFKPMAGGIKIRKEDCEKQFVETPIGEKEREVVEAKSENTIETLL